MRLQEIIGIVQEYFSLAFILVAMLAGILLLVYFGIYKKCFKGKKSLSKKKLFLLVMFSGYVIMVIGVTFLNRNVNYYAGVDLSLFSSYREAWYFFSVRHWQYIFLNILMFVPFGILFPLLHSRLRKAAWTIGVATLCTLLIESIQLLTGYGNFVVDDLFNNLLGAVIGYGLTMGFTALKEKEIKRMFFYFSPLLLVIILSTSTYTYYQSKEFGNLSIVATNKVKMGDVNLTSDVSFSDKKEIIPIYQAPSYTKAEADEFAETLFGKLNVGPSDIEDISYPDLGIYQSVGEKAYSLWFQFLDGGYSFTDFLYLQEKMDPKDSGEASLKSTLKRQGIAIPNDLPFQKIDTGVYKWSAKKEIRGNQLIDGSLTVTHYNDHTVKEIENQLITYDKLEDVQIKSEQEVFEDISKGKFQIHLDNNQIDTIQIHQVQISYHLDSKGYFQPVYAFQCTIDGSEITILVPAM